MAALILFPSCRSREQSTAQSAAPPLIVSHLCEEESVRSEIRTFGTVSSVKKADILPPSESRITDLLFEEGDRVEAGDLIAVLDLRQIDLQIRETEASVRNRESALELCNEQLAESRRNMEARFYSIESAEIECSEKKSELERMEGILENKRRLLEIGGITREEFLSVELEYLEKESLYRQAACTLDIQKIGFRDRDLAEAGYPEAGSGEIRIEQFIDLNTRVLQAEAEMAESELAAAVSSLESLRLFREENHIRAPFSGIVVRRYMDEGETCSRDKPIYHISTIDQVHVRIRMSSDEMNLLTRGGSAEISLPELRRGLIDRISPWIQNESGSGEVMVLVDNSDGIFRLGEFLRVTIPLEGREKRIHIPDNSLLGSTVFLIREGRIFRRDIETGEAVDMGVPVLKGLEPGDRIVLAPEDYFQDGMEVSLR